MKNISAYKDRLPTIGKKVFIDESARVIGSVTLGDDCSVWPQCSIRGDVNYIIIGARSNIQDNCVIHVARPRPDSPEGHPTIIGERVTIGHGVVLHGCEIQEECLIGNRAVVLDGAVIEKHVMVGANTLVPPNKRLVSGYLYIGSPCKQTRPLNEKEMAFLKVTASEYVNLKNDYLD